MEKNTLKAKFIDTGFLIALINEKDQYHQIALQLSHVIENQSVVITDCVLLEVGNALAKNFRKEAMQLINYFENSSEVNLVHLKPTIFQKAYQLYALHQDKTWGLVDCVSFVVMREMKLNDVLTFDKHFSQAGFNIVSL